MCIKEVVNKHRVIKRRLYDIINVMEGAGLIERKGRNLIGWIGPGSAALRRR